MGRARPSRPRAALHALILRITSTGVSPTAGRLARWAAMCRDEEALKSHFRASFNIAQHMSAHHRLFYSAGSSSSSSLASQSCTFASRARRHCSRSHSFMTGSPTSDKHVTLWPLQFVSSTSELRAPRAESPPEPRAPQPPRHVTRRPNRIQIEPA